MDRLIKRLTCFGTGTLAATVATGGSNIMAAVMAGGMVPPLAVFVATLIFKQKFDQQNDSWFDKHCDGPFVYH